MRRFRKFIPDARDKVISKTAIFIEQQVGELAGQARHFALTTIDIRENSR